MKHPGERNFDIFVSLLLAGFGVGLILIPRHLDMIGKTHSAGFLAGAGFFCFITALTIQISAVWRLSQKWNMFMRVIVVVLLAVIGWMFLLSGHLISTTAVWVGALMQLALLLPLNEHLRQLDFLHLGIALISFITGIVLSVTSFNSPQGGAVVPSMAAGFLISSFFGMVAVVLPWLRYARLLNQTQLIPWGAFVILCVLPAQYDMLITPAAVIGMLVFGSLIPWQRLAIPEGDILSHRVVLIAFTIEIAHLVFLGALLFAIDPGFDAQRTGILTTREASLAFFLLVSTLIYYAVTTVMMTSSGLIRELNRTEDALPEPDPGSWDWSSRLERYLKPFIMTPEGVRGRIQADQITTLTRQTAIEKKRNAQLTLLLELSQQLENQLDQPVSAQLAVNTLERALNCSLVMILTHDAESRAFNLLAAAGRSITPIPAGYTQDAATGVIGRALRQRKTQIVNDIRMEREYVAFKEESNLSAAVIPLIFNGHVHGVITLNHEKVNAFGSLEIGLAESVAAELIRAWGRSSQHQRLKELIQSGSLLSSAPDPETAAQEVASISRDIVQAKFTYIYIQLGQERNFIQHASSGKAPQLLASMMSSSSAELIDMAFHASQPFRIRDVRKYDKTSSLDIDNTGLRSLLAIPIRWHHVTIGSIFAFGKQNEVFFTENDESLAELISIQAGGAFESTWLQQELRSSLRITSLLYRLSNQIIQSENIEDAASDIAQTAHKLAKNLTTGIVLVDSEGGVIAETRIDGQGARSNTEHPMSIVGDAMKSGQMIYFSPGQSVLRTCLPIRTPIRSYGAIWMDAQDDPVKPAANPNDLQALVNQAAIALERSLLLVESRRQAKEIKAAYDTLAATYDQTLASLTSALDARDRETEGHSLRVTTLCVKLGESLGYPADKLKILERGALLHDIGKIGISDIILHKPGPLTEDEWKIMKHHPDIGAKIVDGIPFLEDTIHLIQRHQERWDGSGYPDGMKGGEIPELARLFAVVDAFDALTTKRPYREKISKQAALAYLKEQSGILFDPAMVTAFGDLLQNNLELLAVSEE